MSRRSIRLGAWVALLAVLAGGGFLYWQQLGGIAVETTRPRRGPAVEAIYATGTVEAEKWARIAPLTTGRIAEILVREGETVRQGQPLARLDDREARANIAELEAKAAYYRDEMERAAILVERGVRAREGGQKARSDYDQVMAAIAAARKRRSDLIITAPIDGVVLRRDGEVGELAESKDTLFWVGAPRPLRITAEIDEEDIARVRVGQTVLIKADSYPDRALEGRVDRITPKGDPVNKTFRVRVSLSDDTPLLIGMTTEVNIITARRDDALLIAATALVDGSVWQVESGVIRPQAVSVGLHGRGLVEITGGLAPDATVVAVPPPGLKAGDRVRVR